MQLFRSLPGGVRTLPVCMALLGAWDCNPPGKGESLTDAEAALAPLSDTDVASLASRLESQLQIETKYLAKENDREQERRGYPFHINLDRAIAHLKYETAVGMFNAQYDPVNSRYVLRFETRAWGPPQREYTFIGQRECIAVRGSDQRLAWQAAHLDDLGITGCRLLHERYEQRQAKLDSVAYQDLR